MAQNKPTFDDIVYGDNLTKKDIIDQIFDSWNQGNEAVSNFLENYHDISGDDIEDVDDDILKTYFTVESKTFDSVESSNQGIAAYRVEVSFDKEAFKKGNKKYIEENKALFTKKLFILLSQNTRAYADVTDMTYRDEPGGEYIYITYNNDAQRRIDVTASSCTGILEDFIKQSHKDNWVHGDQKITPDPMPEEI